MTVLISVSVKKDGRVTQETYHLRNNGPLPQTVLDDLHAVMKKLAVEIRSAIETGGVVVLPYWATISRL